MKSAELYYKHTFFGPYDEMFSQDLGTQFWDVGR